MEANTNNGIFKVSIGVLIGIMALLGYLFMGARNETLELQKSLTTKVEQLSATQIKLDSISKALDEKIIRIRKLGGSIAELKRVRAQLENDKRLIKSDLNFSLQKYKSKINDYENFLTVKDKDLAKIKEENDKLLARTKTLEEEKEQVVYENTSLKNDKETLFQRVAEYSLENDDLQRQVTLASAMKAINVQVAAISPNGKVRTEGFYKSSRIDRLKISFIMPSNPVAIKNRKDIYVRILDSEGGVMTENATAGVLTSEEKELGYSLKQSVVFENNDQKVDVIYEVDSPYKIGKYIVELYSEGFKIGRGSFEVR